MHDHQRQCNCIKRTPMWSFQENIDRTCWATKIYDTLQEGKFTPIEQRLAPIGFTLSKTNRKSPKKLQNMEVGEEGAIFSLFLREKIVQRAGHPKVWCCCCCCNVIPLQWTDANKNHLFSFYEAGKNVGSCEMLFLNNGPFLASFSSFLSLRCNCKRFAIVKYSEATDGIRTNDLLRLKRPLFCQACKTHW